MQAIKNGCNAISGRLFTAFLHNCELAWKSDKMVYIKVLMNENIAHIRRILMKCKRKKLIKSRGSPHKQFKTRAHGHAAKLICGGTPLSIFRLLPFFFRIFFSFPRPYSLGVVKSYFPDKIDHMNLYQKITVFQSLLCALRLRRELVFFAFFRVVGKLFWWRVVTFVWENGKRSIIII